MCYYDDSDLLTCESCRTPYSDPSTWVLITPCAAFLAGPRVVLLCSEEPTFPGHSIGVTPDGDLCRRCTIIKEAREADKDRSSSTTSKLTVDLAPAEAAETDPTATHSQERRERLKRTQQLRAALWTAHGMPDLHPGRPRNADGPKGEQSECVPHSCPFRRKCPYGCASNQAKLQREQEENMLLPRRPENLVDGEDPDELPPLRCPFTYFCPIKCLAMQLRKSDEREARREEEETAREGAVSK